MAKQIGVLRFTGTVDDFCFYRMEGDYYVRRKSTLTTKRFWKEASFEGSRRSATRFAEGNRLASRLYRMVVPEKKAYALFCFLKRRSILLLKEGKTVPEAAALLVDYLTGFGLLSKATCMAVRKKISTKTPFTVSTLSGVIACRLKFAGSLQPIVLAVTGGENQRQAPSLYKDNFLF